MRSSIAIASLCVAFASASPIVKKGLEIAAPAAKEIIETHVDIVTDVVMVTVTGEPVIVTAGVAPTQPPAIVTVSAPGYYQPRPHRHSHSHSQAAASPAPTSNSPYVVVVTETQTPSYEAPAPTSEAPVTTSEAPVTTSEAPAPTSEAPVTTSSVAPVTTEAAKVITYPASSAPAAETTPAAAATDALSPTAVTSHNDARASHKASAMTWNQTLADYALQEGSCTQFAHDLTAGGGGYGQNIAVAGNSNSAAYTTEGALADAIKEWYAEESLYGSLYGVASPSESVGDFLHFTQMVWQGSHQVGCAVKTCGTDNSIYPGMYIWYSVCNYYPAGNVIGEFATNVLA
ncbi:hypothetical protein DID88_007208 [Monilinia fructigena]|uniref:SCP domain-containing protein n=1 Tax=Monilinia fructigena TaxID=38457 RepID=A0A395J7Q4_9HELO|nr:hypothetical protein DID88_007208 [Monilinia fructigena]